MVVAAVLASAPAHAQAPARAAPEPKPDPAAVEAGDANLEPTTPRQGVIATLGIGGAASIGLGMKRATGQGGAYMLRLAHVANARTVIAVEALGSALFFSISGKGYRTDATSFLLAIQLYLGPALWLRGAAGFGRYAGNELRNPEFILQERFRYAGPAGSVGAGVDIVQLHRFRASVEFSSTALLNRDGLLSSNGFLLGLTLD